MDARFAGELSDKLWSIVKFLLSIIFCAVTIVAGIAQPTRTNVLSFYAVNNSIDGQPLINRKNILRFYPVFALHDSVEYVTVTVYHGNEVSVASSVKFMNGRYWESV